MLAYQTRIERNEMCEIIRCHAKTIMERLDDCASRTCFPYVVIVGSAAGGFMAQPPPFVDNMPELQRRHGPRRRYNFSECCVDGLNERTQDCN